MRELLTVDRVANKIRLLRSNFEGTFLLVEGRSDKMFYERFVDKKHCQLIVTSGKPSSKQRAIEILEILEKSHFEGILAIVDADFDYLLNLFQSSPNILRTDTHDLESMIIKSPALEKVVNEFGSEEKMTKFNRDIRGTLLKTGISVGYLLWTSQRDRLNLTFDGIKFNRFVDEKTLQIDELKMIREVNNKSQSCLLEDIDLQKKLTNYKSSSHDPWQVCCGHHLVEILSISLRNLLGSNKVVDVEFNRLEISLRLAYEEVYFQQTQLYSDIRIWESNNQSFKVLRIDI